MASSPPNKLFPNQRGFPTPNAAPAESGCRIFSIPADEEWYALLMDAVNALTAEWAWFQNGALTPAEAAQAWIDIMAGAYDLAETGICASDVPAPYWEGDLDNEDGESSAVSQSWYGIVTAEVWYEQISDWVIAGFLAIAATPGAAVQYLTYVPRFRLALRTHDIGSAVKIFLDGTEIFAGDTYSADPGVKEVDVFADLLSPDTSPHTILVVQDSASQLQIIRKRLDESEVYPTSQRYDAGTDAVQWTPDGGTTWTDAPDFDPRHSPGFLLPPVAADDQRCQAAANIVQWIHDFIDAVEELLLAGSLVIAVANKLLEFLTFLTDGATILFELILDVADLIDGVGYAALIGGFTGDAYDALLCIFYCNLSANGQCSAEQLTTIEGQIADQIGGTVEIVLDAIFGAQGEIGVSNAGVVGTVVDPDCSACLCGWCYNFDFASTPGGWSSRDYPGVSGHDWCSAWVSGQGWENVPAGCISNSIKIQLTEECVLSYAIAEFLTYGLHLSYGSNADGSGSTTLATWGNTESGVAKSFSEVTIPSGHYLFLYQTSGTRITRLQLQNTVGTNPFGANNC